MATHPSVYVPQARGGDCALAYPSGVSTAITVVGRFLFALIFLMSGPMHFTRPEIQAAAAQGLPAAGLLVPLAGIIAFLGGLSILLGYHARIGAWLLVIFLIPVTLIMHNFWAVSDPMIRMIQMAHFMKNASMLGAALLITQLGSGPFSLDARRSRSIAGRE